MYFYSWIFFFIVILLSTFLSVLTTGKIRNYSNKFLIKRRKKEIGRTQKKFVSRMGGINLLHFNNFFLVKISCWI